MKSLDEVIQNEFLISKNYKRVLHYDFISPLTFVFDEINAFIIFNMESENIIEFINPFPNNKF